MTSTSAMMNPAAADNHNHPHDEDEWPTLSPDQAPKTTVDGVAAVDSSDDWELLPEDSNGNVEVTRSPTVVRIVEPTGEKQQGLPANLKAMKHCASSPDLRHFVLESESSSSGSSSSASSQSGDDSSAVLVDSNDISVASSSVVVVQAPAAKSVWGGGVSFKETLLKDGAVEQPKKVEPPKNHYHHRHHKHKKRAKKQPNFVVKPITRSAKSTGDLQKLELIAENEADVLGATDAEQYYTQKAQGVISNRLGRKMRPDEHTRYKMINNRKNDQRRAQGIHVPDEAYM